MLVGEDETYCINKYENKPVIKTKTDKGDRVIKEEFYYYICPRCDRDVVEIHRYKRNAAGNIAKCEKELLVGEKASDYLILSRETRKYKLIEFRDKIHSKGIPLRYGKAINDETVRMRYINEAGFDGGKIETKVTILT